MDSIESALLAAWRVVYPQLLADPPELTRRLARRNLTLLQRPPRAWCLAIRASDRRIPSPDNSQQHGKHLPHTVTLSASLLRALCQPVTIERPGEPWKDVARKLGVHPRTLNTGRINGLFRHIFQAPQANHRGRPVPILYTDQLLDPAARRFVVADPLWTWTATYLTHRLDPAFEQTLRREPLYVPTVSKLRYREHSHPEAGLSPRALEDPRRLPAPPRDPVWYKWQGNTYIGDEIENRLKLHRQHRNAVLRQHRSQHPAPRHPSGSLLFRRLQWICPQCNHSARVLYLPLAPIELPVTSGQLPAGFDPIPNNQKSKNANQKSPPSPLATNNSQLATTPQFACRRCHRVRFLTGHGKGAWNDLIAHLSGGLLYGRDVPRPPDFVSRQVHQPHRPSITRAPSQRREQITNLLLKPMSQSQIAAALGISYGTVHTHVHRIFKQHNVHSHTQLARKLGVSLPNPTRLMRDEVLRLTLTGLSRPQIIQATGLTYNQIHHHQRRIFLEHRVGTCKELRAKLGGKVIERGERGVATADERG